MCSHTWDASFQLMQDHQYRLQCPTHPVKAMMVDEYIWSFHYQMSIKFFARCTPKWYKILLQVCCETQSSRGLSSSDSSSRLQCAPWMQFPCSEKVRSHVKCTMRCPRGSSTTFLLDWRKILHHALVLKIRRGNSTDLERTSIRKAGKKPNILKLKGAAFQTIGMSLWPVARKAHFLGT